MRKIRYVQDSAGIEYDSIFKGMIEAFNEMVDQHNEAMGRRMGQAASHMGLSDNIMIDTEAPKMRTKQETIDYCQSAVNNIKRVQSAERGEKEIARFNTMIYVYEDVIKFLEDETTETTLLG